MVASGMGDKQVFFQESQFTKVPFCEAGSIAHKVQVVVRKSDQQIDLIMSSPTARAADNKREEFRRYLERCGVMETITRALETLYEEPEKPEDALRYICNRLGHNVESQPVVDALQSELEETRFEMQRMQEEIDLLRAALASTDREFDPRSVLASTSRSDASTYAQDVEANRVKPQ